MSRASARYPAPYLAVQHLRRSSELGKRVVPEIQLKDLPEAVLGVLAAVQRFIVKRDAMIAQLIEGLPVDDPAAYAEAVCSLMK